MKGLRAGVWVAQVLLAVFYAAAGVLKMFAPIDEIPGMIPWTADYSEGFVRFTGFIDLLAAAGILLPDLLRIWTWITIPAALGSAVLQVFAIAFHLWRGEFAVLLINFSALALSIFILWGWAKTRSSSATKGPA
jgi:uncharacterized membrane protein